MKDNWENIFDSYFETYSGLEIEDIYKFIFQGVFGPEGRFDDRSKAKFMLEFAKARPEDSEVMMLKISPKKSLYRINMGAYKKKGGDQGALFEWYYRSFNFDYGSLDDFDNAWSIFEDYNLKNEYFHPDIIKSFSEKINRFRLQNRNSLPIINHSQLFILMNKPAYRVVNFRAMIGALKDSILSEKTQ